MEPEIQKQLIDTGKVKFVYNHYVVVGNAPSGESFRAAEAAECAGDQNKFWEYHDLLFKNQGGENVGTFADPKLVAFAQQLGLDMTKFNACFNSGEKQSIVEASDNLGKEWGVRGTPTVFVVNDSTNQRVQVTNPLDINEIVQTVNQLSGAQ